MSIRTLKMLQFFNDRRNSTSEDRQICCLQPNKKIRQIIDFTGSLKSGCKGCRQNWVCLLYSPLFIWIFNHLISNKKSNRMESWLLTWTVYLGCHCRLRKIKSGLKKHVNFLQNQQREKEVCKKREILLKSDTTPFSSAV